MPGVAVFTGIIEHLGTIDSLGLRSNGGRITINAPSLRDSLAVSQSIAVNGCCLTVVELSDQSFAADLSAETLAKTSFRALSAGTQVNLEKPLTAAGEFGGHLVLGHVDGTGRVIALVPEGEGWRYSIEIPAEVAPYVVSGGSITFDGISLTVARWQNRVVETAIIPYTYEHTNIRGRKPGDLVNLEGDVFGKYVERHLKARKETAVSLKLSVDDLLAQGF
jgi:riboflavin synthase